VSKLSESQKSLLLSGFVLSFSVNSVAFT